MYFQSHVNSSIAIFTVIEILRIAVTNFLGQVNSADLPVVHTCCEFQFEFIGAKCKVNDELERKEFPEHLLGKYRLTPNVISGKNEERISLPLETLELTDYGYFQHGWVYISPSQYCIDSLGPTSAEVIISFPDAQQPRILNKCCKMDYAYDPQMRQCFRSKLPWGRLKQETSGRKSFVANSIPECKNLLNFTSIRYWDSPVRFNVENSDAGVSIKYQAQDGVFLHGVWRTLSDKYCIDQLQPAENYQPTILNQTIEDKDSEIVFYCVDDLLVSQVDSRLLLGCMWIFIGVLLAVAAILNVFIVQRNVHGYVLFGYLLSSGILNVVAAVFIMIPDGGKAGCSLTDFVQKFFYLSTLCWMTMVNFDLWYDFRRLEPKVRKSMKRLPCYIFVAWGLPILIITMCWTVGTRRLHKILTHCVLYDYELIIYSSGPVVLLIIFNLLLFVRTAVRIRGLRKATKKVLRHSRRQRESFKLFSKLFLMTGPIWILRVILLTLQIKGTYLSWYGVLLETIFIIPDITFFTMVVCHRKVLDELMNKMPCLKGILCCPQTSRPPDLSSSARSLRRDKLVLKQEKNGSIGDIPVGNGLYVIPADTANAAKNYPLVEA